MWPREGCVRVGGGDMLKKVRRRSEGEGQGGWGSADHPRTVKEAFFLFSSQPNPENMWSVSANRQIEFTLILTSVVCTCFICLHKPFL